MLYIYFELKLHSCQKAGRKEYASGLLQLKGNGGKDNVGKSGVRRIQSVQEDED